jgi:hypothetical protein
MIMSLSAQESHVAHDTRYVLISTLMYKLLYEYI